MNTNIVKQHYHMNIDDACKMMPVVLSSIPVTRVALLPAQSDSGPPNNAPTNEPREYKDTTSP